ncbi:DNA cytosine methyltransferase [Polynucleobacter rarus]|uniref:DNA cytosine methyltransferase n=1 Tax=Polynucleobacter rarus TaxID=556055 RepID=UPI000D3E7DE5|nr:DNA cytosine methyltransferase [Polynucleobacter rarus]
MSEPIPVIDLFAGPGGLGEGFSSLRKNGEIAFKLKLSVEKEQSAYQTLMLRALFRAFGNRVPDSYYDFITGHILRQEFYKDIVVASHFDEATNEARNATLGVTPTLDIDRWIKSGVKGQSKWVLIGGPPCQAYSIAGRSKMMNNIEKYESDVRHLLYKEYLRIIEHHAPPVFIMENVKGMLSSKLNGELIFKKIITDLSNPKTGLEYEIRSLTLDTPSDELEPRDFIIKSELYGIPQARHRVILFGVRKDLAKKKHLTLRQEDQMVTVNDVLKSMPHIRSKLSQEKDSLNEWYEAVQGTKSMLSGWNPELKKTLIAEMERNAQLSLEIMNAGSPFCKGKPKALKNSELNDWLIDPKLNGVIQHQSRSHMRSDIQRYFLLSNYAKVLERSPKIRELPPKLLPNHQNASSIDAPFQDRFRVQLGDQPSTTIVSHISKDGHYYIHPDPSQARSLTVREAARLQTFPDNYYFEGNKTSQYGQVGNAVPPLLAKKIAEIVYAFLGN